MCNNIRSSSSDFYLLTMLFGDGVKYLANYNTDHMQCHTHRGFASVHANLVSHHVTLLACVATNFMCTLMRTCTEFCAGTSH